MTNRPYYVILSRMSGAENWNYLTEGEAGSPEEAAFTLLDDFQIDDDDDLKIYEIQMTASGNPAIYTRSDLQIET